MNGCGHEDCMRSSAYPTTCLHHALGAVALAESMAHRHRWVYDGMTPVGSVIYHCDDHDPPIVRVVIAPLAEIGR